MKNLLFRFFLILCSVFGIFSFSSFLFLRNFECKGFSFYDGDDIKTDSVLLINTDTEMPIFEKNSEKRRSMASLTKIMTYIIIIENAKDIKIEKVKVKKQILNLLDSESSVSGLKENDELTVFDLLHCLLIRSGNDAALVLADYIGKGGIDDFVKMMNIKAEELGCLNTHFTNVDGMFDENHYSTAKDMYKITSYAMKLPYFMEICGKRQYKVFDDDRPVLRTTNKMMEPGEREYYCPYVKGIKTGWHSEAGRCLISYAVKSNVSYICVAMGGPETDINGDGIKENLAMIETKKLYTWAFENLSLKTISNRNDPMCQIKLKYAWKKDKIILSPETTIKIILPKEFKISDLTTAFFLPDFINAPVEAGDFIGKAELKFGNSLLKEVNLVSGETVPLNFFSFITEKIKDVVFSRIFIISGKCLILLLICYLIFLFWANKKKMKNKKRLYIQKNKKRKIINK